MKISMELNVSDKEFYDLMMKSLKEEVKNVTKKNLELKEGLKYKKKSAQRKGIGSEITVHIKRLIPNTKLRVDENSENVGLDDSEHGECAYSAIWE